ncbi:hypothetical protein F5051DRAFT_447578 [Lentinula edodes]|nr:hypothetical protein F5051DRAFT_447578 [Lentinula edodes]
MDRVEDILRGQSSEIEPSIALGARLSHVSPGRGSRGRPAGAKTKDQTSSSTHTDYERGQSVKTERGQSVKTERGQSVKTERGQSVKTERGQSVKTERGQSIETEHDNVVDDVKNGPEKHKNNAISNSTADVEGSRVSDEYIPTARPLLLVDPKGHLVLPDLTGPEVEELASIDRVRASFRTFVIIHILILYQNGEPFRRSSPLFELDESLLNLGTILSAQNTRLNFKDLVTLNRTIRLPTVDDQACISLLSRGESNLNDIGSQLGSKCQRCQKSSKRCLSEMQLSTAIPAMNNIFVASQICTDNLRLLLHRLLGLYRHMEVMKSGYAQTKTSFLQTMRNLQTAGANPPTVLEALRLRESEHHPISVEEMTALATLFNWSIPSNFLKLDDASGYNIVELLQRIHSGQSTIDDQGREISCDTVISSSPHEMVILSSESSKGE